MVHETTTIQISKRTRDKLKSLGKKGETYDQIIRRILKTLEKMEEESDRKA